MDLTMENNVDPWNMEVKITPSASLIQLFQDWDQTKSSVKKLCSFNRAKQWICLLLNRPEEAPSSHKMRLTDHLAAIDHMAVAHRSGISHDDYLRSCLAPIQTEAKNDIIAKVDTNIKVVIKDAAVKTEEFVQVPEGSQSQIQNQNLNQNQNLIFFCPSPIKSVINYGVAWMGPNFYNYDVKHYETPYQYMYIVALGCHSLHENAHVNFSDQMTREMTASKKLF